MINASSTESGPIDVKLGLLNQAGTTRASVQILGWGKTSLPVFFFISPDIHAEQVVVRQVDGSQGALDCNSRPVALIDEPPLSATPFVDQAPGQIGSLQAIPVGVRIVRLAEPDYPILSKNRGEQGTAIIRITVNPHGSVIDSAVIVSSGFPGLDAAASFAAGRLQYTAPTIMGEPVTLLYDIGYTFILR